MYGKIIVSVCLFLMGINAKTNAQAVTVEDLTGKWTLVKIEAVRVQNNVEIDTQSYTPDNYKGKIYFETVECLPNGKANYGGKCDDGLLSGGSIQIHAYDLKNYIVFNGKAMGARFEFEWSDKPNNFVLVNELLLDQLSNEKEKILFHYTKK